MSTRCIRLIRTADVWYNMYQVYPKTITRYYGTLYIIQVSDRYTKTPFTIYKLYYS